MPFRHVIADDSHAKWGAKTFLSENTKKVQKDTDPFCIIKETNFQSQAPQKARITAISTTPPAPKRRQTP